MTSRNTGEKVAEDYYDSTDADTFYERVWGGEDIHIGLYEEGLSIFDASRKTVELMAETLLTLNKESKVLDLGSGYGGSARYLANKYACHVTCLNLSDVQNARNKILCQEQGVADKVSVLHGSFESIPCEENEFDIVWSQDAFLHSGHKTTVLKEINRVLKPSGELIFTDPMQSDDCPDDVLQPVYDRLNLDSLGSFAFYKKHLEAVGFKEETCIPMTPQLRTHYSKVGNELKDRYHQLTETISIEYMDKMLLGLQHWVDAADSGYLAWGVIHYRKTHA
jgi:sarcosine/dimethylglycine N-methyltransferase